MVRIHSGVPQTAIKSRSLSAGHFDAIQKSGYSLGAIEKDFSIHGPDSRIDQIALNNLKPTLGSYRYAGQFQQRPAASRWRHAEGALVALLAAARANLPSVLVKLPDGTLERRHAVEPPSRFQQDPELGHGVQGHQNSSAPRDTVRPRRRIRMDYNQNQLRVVLL